MSLSSPGHHISPNRHPVGTYEHPVPPCTPPCSQRLASPQPVTSHLHTTSFIFASSISASSHCSAVLATTSTLTAIGLAVGASEAPVPLKANSTFVYGPLPVRSPPHTIQTSAHTTAPLPLRPPPLRHKLVPWQQARPHAAAPIASACPRPSPCTHILTHVSHPSEALWPPHIALRSGWPRAAANPFLRFSTLLYTRAPPCPRKFSYPQLSPPHHHPFVAASS